MTVDLTAIFVEYLARNRGPDPNDPDYRQRPNHGIEAELDGNILKVELIFRKDSAYCCYEWECHVRMFDGKRWDDFRRCLAAQGIAAPPQLELHLNCIIEQDALFFDFGKPDPSRRGWYAFAPATAHRYARQVAEAAAPEDNVG
jgi:hypothetical protein